MERTALEILFEDAHCLAVSKPAGWPVQAATSGQSALEEAVRHHLAPSDPASAYLGMVHRLDRPASGVILWAKTPKAARRLAEQFASRKVHKEYWAIVEGAPATGAGLWEDWLCADDSTGLGRVQVCSPQTPRARQARTRFERGQAAHLPPACSWLRLWPETGRTHQLRVQTSTRGLPILGDRAYGAVGSCGAGIALHARALAVEHPILHQPLRLVAPLPPAWQESGIKIEVQEHM